MTLLDTWLPKELRRERDAIAAGSFAPIARDSGGPGSKARAKLVQEWLCLAGHQIVIDGDFGPATAEAVGEFRAANALGAGEAVDGKAFEALTRPMLAALQPLTPSPATLDAALLAYARQHLAEHPREVGGDNCGPWVRLYMDGKEGAMQFWCAGFVTFLLRQASDTLGRPMPIRGSVSCDSLAAQAKEAGRFVGERARDDADLPPGAIFLRRNTPTDWAHTGVVTAFGAESFKSIEGNTNDDGHRNGVEVCARTRGYKKRDFIRID